tara:strand:- start:6851 stop:7261 length:411 start_codon:yes stop_codon:yes gene_type:complete
MSKFSIQAYIDIQPSIKPSEELIMSLLSRGGATLREVAERLSMPLQTASARLSELHDRGFIHQSEYHKATYTLTPPENVGRVKEARDKKRYEKWYKLGIIEGYFGKETRDLMDKIYDENGNERNPLPELPKSQLAF